eukprot:107816-Prorocentrum_minimum.AAC.1
MGRWGRPAAQAETAQAACEAQQARPLIVNKGAHSVHDTPLIVRKSARSVQCTPYRLRKRPRPEGVGVREEYGRGQEGGWALWEGTGRGTGAVGGHRRGNGRFGRERKFDH